MSSGNAAEWERQQQVRAAETAAASENEESESATDDQSTSQSEDTRKSTQISKTRKHSNGASKHRRIGATQFSIQPSDIGGGLRMKISAIRPVGKSQTGSQSERRKASRQREEADKREKHKMAAPAENRTSVTSVNAISDAAESGCSEATTTTTNATANEKLERVKVKRKKLSAKDIRAAKEARVKRPTKALSSDSEHESTTTVEKMAQNQQQQQRTPRLLLTAVPNGQAATNGSAAEGVASSSDTELPMLIKAAIERVNSDTEDTVAEGSGQRGGRSKKNLAQYQLTLLQTYEQKTQMVGSDVPTTSRKAASKQPLVAQPIECIAVPSSAVGRPKKRGRPKKNGAKRGSDSGILSNTPSPKEDPLAVPTLTANDNSNDKQMTPSICSPSVNKLKIDTAYLDKRMYAAERVLYPPPRSKRRHSTASGFNMRSKKQSKDDLQLDPVWKEIDVSKKFRLRSVSVGYRNEVGSTLGISGGNGHKAHTVCSKILAAKSVHLPDYGGVHHRGHHNHGSGYKSDASGKSRYSMKSNVSRRSRAGSCGYRSDRSCKSVKSTKSSRFRRKRRASIFMSQSKAGSKPLANPKDEQDILQLAGLSLGRSSEESSEYTCKPNLKSVPSTSERKKYGEINRFITTGQYFGRGNSSSQHNDLAATETFTKGMLFHRKSFASSEIHPSSPLRKIKSRRSSAASYCSSYYSATSRVRRRHRHRGQSMPRSGNRVYFNLDSKFLTEIDIIATRFASHCRIRDDRLPISSDQEKLMAKASRLQQSLTTALASQSGAKVREKRSQKKRKLNNDEMVDFAMLSASAAAGGLLTPNSSTSTGKRRHKKTNSSSSPDDHKLPLKKRHHLIPPGDKPVETLAFTKLNAGDWAAADAVAKTTLSSKSQAQLNARSGGVAARKSGLTPKKRQFLHDDSVSNSPLRVAVESSSVSGGKLLDISPSSLCSLNRRRSRYENALSKTAEHRFKTGAFHAQLNESSSSCPPPGVFEPSIELEIQIPPISKLSEVGSIITKAEVESPLLQLDLNGAGGAGTPKHELGSKVVETLLHKASGNHLLKRKRKKINRTGFPTVRKKKRRVNDELASVANASEDLNDEELEEDAEDAEEEDVVAPQTNAKQKHASGKSDRQSKVAQVSETNTGRVSQRAPRLSVVALERLRSTPKPDTLQVKPKLPRGRPCRKPKTELNEIEGNKNTKESPAAPAEVSASEQEPKPPLRRGRKTKAKETEKVESKPEPKESAGNPNAVGRKRTKSVAAVKAPVAELPPTKSAEQRESSQSSRVVAKKRLPKESTTASVTATGRPPGRPAKSTKIQNAKTDKVLAAKPKVIESNVKLPAGVDPNTIFACKIRLKRRKSLHALLAVDTNSPLPTCENSMEAIGTPEDINIEAAAKDAEEIAIEHDVLPLKEATKAVVPLDIGSASDTADESSSTASLSTRKLARVKKNYLVAGLLSSYFKQDEMPPPRDRRKVVEKTSSKVVPKTTGEATKSKKASLLLPPPPYCERYLRRTVLDFQLPYDIWWAYKNAKLPNRSKIASWNYRKLRTNVYAETVRPNVAGYEHPTCNCKPEDGCQRSCLNRMVYTECSPTNCPAGDKCRNQRIQRYEIAAGIERFMTEQKGWGLRSKLPVKKGTYIQEYAGEVVTEREFKYRMDTIYRDDQHHYCLNLDGGLVIDSQRMGSDCRFVNHSCEPNCEMQKWSVNGLSRMVLFAKRDILDGEELSYDYNFSLFNPSEGQPCKCNAPLCRGVIGGKSQRVKPLPVGSDARNGRQRKRKAQKNAKRPTSKDIDYSKAQELEKAEITNIRGAHIFLMRNFEKVREIKRKKAERKAAAKCKTIATNSKEQIVENSESAASELVEAVEAVDSKAGNKISAIFCAICEALKDVKVPNDESKTIVADLLENQASRATSKKSDTPTLNQQPSTEIYFKTIAEASLQGGYDTPNKFDEDVQKLFKYNRELHAESAENLKALTHLSEAYDQLKQQYYAELVMLVDSKEELSSFAPETLPAAEANENVLLPTIVPKMSDEVKEESKAGVLALPADSEEDVIRCICGLYKDEGLMIQCAKCMVWQHAECTKADVDAENYQCELCEPREIDHEIALQEYTEEGHQYYLTLMRGELQVRQGDAVYVLRDIPIKDKDGKIIPAKKHTYKTIDKIDYQECDIFRVEHLWKNSNGERFIFGHHFLRPHETFHEPSRRFYPNEVVRVSLYEVVPIELVIGRCWVLDRTTFCKGRPIECTSEDHCYICELRVDKLARFFSKAKVSYPACTKSYAFRKFEQRLRVSKTYAPHEIDPQTYKPRKPKLEADVASVATTSADGRERNKPSSSQNYAANQKSTLQTNAKKKQTPIQKRKHLEGVIKALREKCKQQAGPAVDLSYLLGSRSGRQRKTT